MPTVCAIFCSLLATLVCTTASHAARHALVIGNDNYATVAKLRNARSDATAMAEALKMAGYQVLLQTDRTQREMLDDVLALQQRVQGGDEVVLFFSGHGVQIGAMNYLLPIDVRSATEAQVKNDAIALNKLLDDVREKRPALTLAIIDACRDNPFKGNGRDIGGRGLTGVAGASGQMVIYAAGEGQQALDRLGSGDQAKNGLFTRVFVKEMTKPDVQVRDVLYNVREEVVRLARSVNHEQVPAIYDQVVGRFYFRTPQSAHVDSGAQLAATTSAPTPQRPPVAVAQPAFTAAMVAAPVGGTPSTSDRSRRTASIEELRRKSKWAGKYACEQHLLQPRSNVGSAWEVDAEAEVVDGRVVITRRDQNTYVEWT